MKVLVTVKQAATAADGFELDGLDVDRRHLEYELNEWDEYAVEAAVRVAEAAPADEEVEVVSVTVGPERTEETIRPVLSKGVDRAIRVWDDALADVHLDVAAKTRLLAAVASAEEPDLTLTGVQSSDDAHGATGVSLADELGVERVAVVNRLEVDDGLTTARVHRELENGIEELIEVDLPAVLTVQVGTNEPRAGDPPGADPKPKPIERCDLADLGLDGSAVASPLRRTALAEPDEETDTTYFEGDADEQAARIADLLREQGVVDG